MATLARGVRLLAFASIVGVLGCRRGGSAKLEGHWRGTRTEGVAANAVDAANALATQTELVASGNTIDVTLPRLKGAPTAYVVDEENAGTLVIHTDAKRDGKGNRETFLFTDKGQTVSWRLGEGRSVVFQKVAD